MRAGRLLGAAAASAKAPSGGGGPQTPNLRLLRVVRTACKRLLLRQADDDPQGLPKPQLSKLLQLCEVASAKGRSGTRS